MLLIVRLNVEFNGCRIVDTDTINHQLLASLLSLTKEKPTMLNVIFEQKQKLI